VEVRLREARRHRLTGSCFFRRHPNAALVLTSYRQFGMLLSFIRWYDEAIAEGKRAIALDPLSPQVLIDASMAFMFKRDLLRPRRWRAEPANSILLISFPSCSAAGSTSMPDSIPRRSLRSPRRGEWIRPRSWPPMLAWIGHDEIFDTLRGEPRFVALLKRMRFPG
jgi:hypothetical protein